MPGHKLMTEAEIHGFGIEIVFGQMEKEGYEILSVNTKLGINPQIVAKKGDRLVFVVVRTACYPKKGVLEDAVHFQMIEHAEKHKAIPYFASVGIANAEAKTDYEMGIPIKGAGFYASYEGLLVITRSDRVKIMDKNGVRDITENDLLPGKVPE